ncbi:sugar ABC transporter ATP-binding protein [Lichenicoccus sp.]|uniref:sugar ABC transporter ATP-binding protein n=1 Tax=Lichenicoccus sp. TaxID=2781899 RepID=UPI003D10DBFC
MAGKARALVEASRLRKSYGGVPALDGIDIDLRAGEVHGLVGANGAGKSTLIRMLAGLVRPDDGSIRVDGAAVAIETPDQASKLGFSFIHQELALVPRMSALENIVLGVPKPTRLGLVDWRRVRDLVEPQAERVGIRFALDSQAESLGVVDRWLVSICRALVRRSRLIVMDEPTASLSEPECRTLHQLVRNLSSEGIAVLYVSHRLDEIISLCHRVTAFRDGRVARELGREDVTRPALIEAIAGRMPEPPETRPARGAAPVLLAIRNLRRGRLVRDVSFDLHRGEVLGLAGLVGAGRSETARIIFGADRAESGSMNLDGQAFAPRGPADAARAGIGLVPEERRSEGLLLEKSVAFNLTLATRRSLYIAPGVPLIDMRKRRRRAEEMMARLMIKAPDADAPVGRLSGGNQQKVVLGKWLTRPLKVLILDEPSRGVDIGARSGIHRIIRALAGTGVSVIVISSEPEELAGLCDRVLVMVEGQIAAHFVGPAIVREALVQASYHGMSTQGRG